MKKLRTSLFKPLGGLKLKFGKKQLNEKGAGIIDTIITVMFFALVAGAVGLLIYNAISDKGNQVASSIRTQGTVSAFDMDGDGYLNEFIFVGEGRDESDTMVKYWRVANPATDYGMPGVMGSLLDHDDDGDGTMNDDEVIDITTSNDSTDMYFRNLGATFKSNSKDPHNPSIK